MKTRGIYKKIRDGYLDDRGITGLETAIILIAFIVVAAVFAFTVMTTGLFSTEKAKTTAQAGIAEASSTFAPKGAIVAQGDAGTAYVETLFMQVTLATGATDDSIQGNEGDTDTGIIGAIAIRKIVGAAPDTLLREGEVAEIEITLNATHDPATNPCSNCVQLGGNAKFRIEIIPPAGGSLILARKTPPGILNVMNLE